MPWEAALLIKKITKVLSLSETYALGQSPCLLLTVEFLQELMVLQIENADQ